jgi:hypothetical protein
MTESELSDAGSSRFNGRRAKANRSSFLESFGFLG